MLRSASRSARAFLLENPLELLPARRQWRHYTWAKLRHDTLAGFNVSLLAVAQGLAFAALAGLPISHGLTCAAIASLVGPLFAGSRHTILGPTNATAFLVFSGMAAVPGPEKHLLLPVLIFMSGALLVVGAYFKLADMIQYVSRAVVTGYLAGSALLIIANQLRSVAGLPPASTHSTTFAGLTVDLLRQLDAAHWPSIAIAAIALSIYLVGRRWFPRLPVFAIALLVGTFAGLAFDHFHWPVARLAGFSPSDLLPALPDLRDPNVWTRFSPHFGLAFAIAFLAALENSIMARSLASQTGDRVDLNQEMLSVGAANLASSFLSGMPASGSLTRSALNHASGAVSQASSLVAGTLCAVAALALGGLVSHIPKPALAMLVICVATSLFNLHHLRICLRATRSDATSLIVTLLATLLMPLQVAIFVGVGLSIVLYLRKASRPELVEYEFNPRGDLTAASEGGRRQNVAISIVHVEGELFFGAAELFRTQIQRLAADTLLRVIILRMKNARHLDATSVMALEELLQFMISKHRYLLISGVSKDVYRVLKNSGLTTLIGRDNIFPGSVQNPNLSTRHALERAQQLLGTRDAEVQIYYDPNRPASS